jgi:hypothetical protein
VHYCVVKLAIVLALVIVGDDDFLCQRDTNVSGWRFNFPFRFVLREVR